MRNFSLRRARFHQGCANSLEKQSQRLLDFVEDLDEIDEAKMIASVENALPSLGEVCAYMENLRWHFNSDVTLYFIPGGWEMAHFKRSRSMSFDPKS